MSEAQARTALKEAIQVRDAAQSRVQGLTTAAEQAQEFLREASRKVHCLVDAQNGIGSRLADRIKAWTLQGEDRGDKPQAPADELYKAQSEKLAAEAEEAALKTALDEVKAELETARQELAVAEAGIHTAAGVVLIERSNRLIEELKSLEARAAEIRAEVHGLDGARDKLRMKLPREMYAFLEKPVPWPGIHNFGQNTAPDLAYRRAIQKWPTWHDALLENPDAVFEEVTAEPAPVAPASFVPHRFEEGGRAA